MIPSIPKGGFFVIKDSKCNLEDVEMMLIEKGAETLMLSEDDLLIAIFEEFSGQGLWCGENGSIAYDLDLTNVSDLLELVDLPANLCY